MKFVKMVFKYIFGLTEAIIIKER